MVFILTEQHCEQILEKNYKDWYQLLKDTLPKYNIDSELRVAGFLAQTMHESNHFKVYEENLKYSADGLNRVFSKYFRLAGRNVQEYAYNPEKIANVVYANRMGNGPESSGEGYKYRGRGLIQLTGKYNYQAFATYKNISLTEAIKYLETKAGALESACWFWDSKNLNKYSDQSNIVGMTKVINGGTNGLQDRIKLFNKVLTIIQEGTTLRVGSKGSLVKQLQRVLNITADGDFGKNTEKALKDWQHKHGLEQTGVATAKILKVLL